jgi:hypothetical protein
MRRPVATRCAFVCALVAMLAGTAIRRGSINFLWMMAAHRETEDRLFGVVNVHPDFAQGGSGLEPGRAGKR